MKKSPFNALTAALLLLMLLALAGCGKKYTVSFILDGGERTGGGELTQTVKAGENAVAPEASLAGHVFMGWKGSFEAVNADTEITALWKKVSVVTFDPAGGNIDSGTERQTVDDGGSAEPPEVSRVGYVFKGWSGEYTLVSGDVTVTALWEKVNTVTFDPAGGSIVSGQAAQSVESGKSAEPPEVRRDGYAFDGWSGEYTLVSGDVTVTALWTKLHTVRFDLNGGYLISGSLTQTVRDGERAAAPSCARSGYHMSGWDNSFATVYSDIVVTAQWVEMTYTAEEIYALASPATVEISAYNSMGAQITMGSGFFVDSSGTIVTNYHVIEDAFSAKATLKSGETYEITQVMGCDEELDLAILRIEKTGTPYLPRTSRKVSTGETVYALGSPKGLTGTLSNGIVSTASVIVNGKDCIQTTAAVSAGSSGGPLINRYGEVVGVVTATLTGGQNINFAVNLTELDKVSLASPTTMEEIYQQNVYYTVMPYEKTLSERESNNSVSSAQRMSENGTTVRAAISGLSDMDYYSFSAREGSELTLMLFPGYRVDAELLYCVLLDSRGEILSVAAAEDFSGGRIQFLLYSGASGTYYAAVFVGDDYPYQELPKYDLFIFVK